MPKGRENQKILSFVSAAVRQHWMPRCAELTVRCSPLSEGAGTPTVPPLGALMELCTPALCGCASSAAVCKHSLRAKPEPALVPAGRTGWVSTDKAERGTASAGAKPPGGDRPARVVRATCFPPFEAGHDASPLLSCRQPPVPAYIAPSAAGRVRGGQSQERAASGADRRTNGTSSCRPRSRATGTARRRPERRAEPLAPPGPGRRLDPRRILSTYSGANRFPELSLTNSIELNRRVPRQPRELRCCGALWRSVLHSQLPALVFPSCKRSFHGRNSGTVLREPSRSSPRAQTRERGTESRG